MVAVHCVGAMGASELIPDVGSREPLATGAKIAGIVGLDADDLPTGALGLGTGRNA